MVERRNGYRVLARNPEGKSLVRRPKCMWEDNIKMELREIGWGSMD
jgi:hypothetical protein